MSEQIRLRIVGAVQGVYYRASAQRAARGLGLVGWVRNTEDGAVEAVAEGPAAALASFVDWCRQGSPAARVDEVQVERAPATGAFTSFDVRRG
jgi:acylphosphatase